MDSIEKQQAHLDDLVFANDDEHIQMPRERVTKLAVARRNLRAALKAWFENEDPLAVHTLLAAAHEVLYDLAEHQGLKDALFDSPLIRPEHLARWHKVVRAPANFMKHADRDPAAELEFDPKLNDLRPMYCLLALRALGEKWDDDLGRAYMIRVGLEYPTLLTTPLHDQYPGSTAAEWERLGQLSRPRFLKIYEAMHAAAKAGFELRIVEKAPEMD